MAGSEREEPARGGPDEDGPRGSGATEADGPSTTGAEPVPGLDPTEPAISNARRLALSTAFFSFATGLSRIAGLLREVVAAALFGVSAAMSAFTIAFQVPNLVRALFADSALQGAFVPVFTELLEKGNRREAFRVASGLASLIVLVLGGVTLLFIVAAPFLIPLFAPGFGDDPTLEGLTVALTQLMFPIVTLLALSGLVVGMLNSFEHFSVPALAPLAWNAVIIASLVGLTPLLDPDDAIYAYAIGVLGGTVVQLVLPLPWLRGRGGRFELNLNWRSPYVRRVLWLMLPVTIALGLINFSLLINSLFGTLVQPEAPAAIEKAFRIYMLPQGLFSVAIATILFPTLSRLAARGATDELRSTMASGVRQICLLLIPSAALMAVLAEPITRLLYERGAFDAAATDLVATATVWWAISLPFQGVSLLLSRTFFALQRPWATTALAGVNMAVNVLVAYLLYAPLGVAGIVIGTVVATVVMTLAQAAMLRGDLGGVEGGRTLLVALRVALASAGLGAAAFGAWYGLDLLLGRSLLAQIAVMAVAVGAGLAVYAGLVWLLRIPEGRQVARLLGGRLRRRR